MKEITIKTGSHIPKNKPGEDICFKIEKETPRFFASRTYSISIPKEYQATGTDRTYILIDQKGNGMVVFSPISADGTTVQASQINKLIPKGTSLTLTLH
jgi:hypothetical protein